MRPSAQIEAAYQRATQQLQQASGSAVQAGSLLAPVRFADTGDGSVAYLELGQRGARCGTLVVLFGLWSHVELSWEEPRIRAMLERLAQRFHVVLMDRRGTGLSERLQVSHTVQAGAEDVAAVLDALGVRQAWLFGNSAGGPIMVEFAATQRSRVRGLVLYGTGACSSAAEGYPWAPTRAQLAAWVEHLHQAWGDATSLAEFAPSAAQDPSARGWWARTLRQSLTRNSMRTLIGAFGDVDVRPRLPQLAVPTLVVQREDDRIVRAGAARYLAGHIAGAQLVMLPGADHLAWHGDTAAVLGALEVFVESRLGNGGAP
jgi:pimeloyl-ACP methyl ester carboxylesterase